MSRFLFATAFSMYAEMSRAPRTYDNHRYGRCGKGRAQAAAERAAPWPSPAALSASLPSQVGKPAGDAPLTASRADPAPPAAAPELRAQAPGQPARAHALVGARARARCPQQQHQRDNARASGARAGSVGSGLSHVGQSDVGHSPHPHPHARAHSYQPVCITNTYYLTYPPLLTRRASRAQVGGGRRRSDIKTTNTAAQKNKNHKLAARL